MGSQVESFLYDAFKHWYRGNGGNVWFYGDPHFGDLDLYIGRLKLAPFMDGKETKYRDSQDRIYTEKQLKEMLKEFDEKQIKTLNSCIGKNGTIVILGDVGDVSYIKLLKGYKVLVRGNHDAGVEKYRRKTNKIIRFDSSKIGTEDASRLQLAKNTNDMVIATLTGTAIVNKYSETEIIDNKLFDEVYKGCVMISDKLILSHVPVDFEYAFNIHGHVHNELAKGDEMHLNCCAEALGYKPISLTMIVKELGLLSNIKDPNQEATNAATARKYGFLTE